MSSKYCKHGHRVLGDTCSHCARRIQISLMGSKNPTRAGAGPNATLTALRTLKSLLEQAHITEAQYDEQRNHILASF
ncbi:SHOCT domain-containing protein [Hymenobacter armeniacus]|uniref:SHOCT domain-containing protein n=1 Tax=Hymenobacter armeniacus TaxID=2771358 RepID=A0ABR8JZW5_9BACT|nr:SHOCT domain-containing protein [Hymenobacter armeniacus]MBD2724217.1 SHOCT domain-containing protein [Hymenobacter armeniacus]